MEEDGKEVEYRGPVPSSLLHAPRFHGKSFQTRNHQSFNDEEIHDYSEEPSSSYSDELISFDDESTEESLSIQSGLSNTFTIDDETSIMYCMAKRPTVGLKRVCEVPISTIQEDQQQKGSLTPIWMEAYGAIFASDEANAESRHHFCLNPSRRRKTFTAVLIVIFALIVLVIVLLLVLTKRTDAANQGLKMENEVLDNVLIPTNTSNYRSKSELVSNLVKPTILVNPNQGTQAPLDADSWTYVLDTLSPHVNKDLIYDAETPQGKAFLQLIADKTLPTSKSANEVIEAYAVLTLYYSTSPRKWDKTFAWKSPKSDVCSWEGVIECIKLPDGSTAVRDITLIRLGFGGTIAKELCLLSFLENLILEGLQLYGQMPSCFNGNMVRLKELNLRNNLLSGPLPVGLLLAPELEVLDLSNNQFTGELDRLVEGVFIKNLFRYGARWRIREIRFENNNFSGEIPEFFGSLGSLERLTFHQNNLIGTVDQLLCERVDQGVMTELTANCLEVSCKCCTLCYYLK